MNRFSEGQQKEKSKIERIKEWAVEIQNMCDELYSGEEEEEDGNLTHEDSVKKVFSKMMSKKSVE
jgi:hypothetical protein